MFTKLLLVLGVSLVLQACDKDAGKDANKDSAAASAAAQELFSRYRINITPGPAPADNRFVHGSPVRAKQLNNWQRYNESDRARIREDLDTFIDKTESVIRAVRDGRAKLTSGSMRDWEANIGYARNYRDSLNHYEGRESDEEPRR